MVKRKVPLGSKTVQQLIEEGKPISGRKAYVKMSWGTDEYRDDEYIFIPVTLIGLKVEEKSCGITITVKPQGGFEQFKVTPCDLFTTKKEVELFRKSQSKIKKAKEEFKEIRKWSTKVSRKRALKDYVNDHNLNKLFKEECNGDDTDSNLKEVAKTLVIQVNKLTPEELDTTYF